MKRIRRRPAAPGRSSGISRNYFVLATLLIPVVVILIAFQPDEPPVEGSTNPYNDAPPIRLASLEDLPPPPPALERVIEVGNGDTLDGILREGGLEPAEILQIADGLTDIFDPRRLRIGEQLRFTYGADDRVDAVTLRVRGWGEIVGSREGGDFRVEAKEAVKSSRDVVVEATIDTTLYDALIAAEASPALIDSLYEVFQWDIDFFRLRRGDWFRFVVERRYAGEEPSGWGQIDGALFHHQGVTYEAFRGEGPGEIEGWYTRTGSPVRKQFLKAPLKAPRITSGYAKRRFHPVLKTWRPHLAIDYGAPTGTPVMTTASGVVTFVGRGRGEGNYVRVRHNLKTETYYLHLSRFADGIRKGAKVEQGDVIGYVGATGLATAPHLDYRVRQDGRFINPLELRSVTPDPLSGRQLATFLASVEKLLGVLDRPLVPGEELEGTHLASIAAP